MRYTARGFVLALSALSLFISLTPRALNAAVDEWSALTGAPGGRIGSLAVAPSRPRVLYASTGSALYKSGDSGSSWRPVYTFDSVASVVVHPTDPDRLYIITGMEGHLEVSEDGGASWQEPSFITALPGAQLVLSPAPPSALYVNYGIGFSKIVDEGATWEILDGAPGLETFGYASDLEADPRRAGHLYLLDSGSAGESQGWFSTDAGASWSSFPLPAGRVADLAVDPAQPRSLLAVNRTGSVWVTSDLGQSWRRPSQTALPSGLSKVWVGGGASPLFVVSTGTRLFVSRDRGRTYEEAGAPLPMAHLSLAFHPARTETFYLGLDGGGVLPTADGGRNFAANGLAGQDLGTPAAHPTQAGALFAASAGELARSFDGGRSWDRSSLGAPDGATLAGNPVFGAGPLPTLFAPLSNGVARSTDQGKTWSFGCPQCGRVPQILTTPADPDLVFALSQLLRSQRSLDGGESWESVDFVPLAIDPIDPQTLYRREGHFPDQRFEISGDGGASWSEATTGLHEDLGVGQFAVHPGGGRMWLGTNEGLYRSDDGAASWQQVWFETEASDVKFLGLDPSDPDTVVAVAESSAGPSLGARLLVTRDGGDSWEIRGAPQLPRGTGALTGDPVHPGTFYVAAADGRINQQTLRTPSVCAGDDTTLCIRQNRFQARVSWQDFQGRTGVGHAASLTDDTGSFWFFNSKNLELAVKALDGTGINGNFWLFYGALSNVEYVLDVVDTTTGQARTYHNPSRKLASRGDTTAFETATASSVAKGFEGVPESHPALLGTAACSPGPTALCLNDGRFRVEVEWKDFQGITGSGRAVPRTSDTGTFWFFNDRNVELVVKVLDGRVVNDHFWVFYGALTNVEYTLTVTDTETGAQAVYENPSGQFRSRADTTAF